VPQPREEPVVVRIDEFWGMSEGERKSVDAVTCATVGLMSGVYAVISARVTEPGEVRRFDHVILGKTRLPVGPCPNERLGMVEFLLPATVPSDPPAPEILRRLASGREVDLVVVDDEGREHEATIGPEDVDRAMLRSTRTCIRNYHAFVNTGDEPVNTIFSPKPLGPGEATFSGCGGYNPLEHDPNLELHRPGRRVLFCGAPAVITGEGTRSSHEKPNLALSADLMECDPRFMGAFRTSAGYENIAGVASAIALTPETEPLLDVKHEDCTLPVVRIEDRSPLTETDYGAVWKDEEVRWDPGACEGCDRCALEEVCPYPYGTIKDGECFHCGLCVSVCPAVSADLGEVPTGDGTAEVIARESSAFKAKKLMEKAVEAVEEGLLEPLEPSQR